MTDTPDEGTNTSSSWNIIKKEESRWPNRVMCFPIGPSAALPMLAAEFDRSWGGGISCGWRDNQQRWWFDQQEWVFNTRGLNRPLDLYQKGLKRQTIEGSQPGFVFFRVVVSAPSILLQDSLPISMTQGVLMLFGVLNKRFRGSPRTRFSTDSQHLIKNDDELQWFVAVWDFCASTVTLRVSRADFANGRDAICFTARRQCDRWY